jgi:hypothetical protein
MESLYKAYSITTRVAVLYEQGCAYSVRMYCLIQFPDEYNKKQGIHATRGNWQFISCGKMLRY